jgi:broad specificity phosphatase PhoE
MIAYAPVWVNNYVLQGATAAKPHDRQDSSAMTMIILVRHGHVEGIEPKRFRGRQETPLTDRGLRQAEQTAQRIAEAWAPRAIYSSPMGRCLTTARAIGEACRLAVNTLSDLIDIDCGEWQWKTYEAVRAATPDAFAQWFSAPHLFRFPKGESLQDLVARAANVLRFATEQHPDDEIVLVGHESINRALLLQVLDQPLSAYWRLVQSPCSISEIVVEGSNVRVVRMNETAHLPSDLR